MAWDHQIPDISQSQIPITACGETLLVYVSPSMRHEIDLLARVDKSVRAWYTIWVSLFDTLLLRGCQIEYKSRRAVVRLRMPRDLKQMIHRSYESRYSCHDPTHGTDWSWLRLPTTVAWFRRLSCFISTSPPKVHRKLIILDGFD